MAAIDRTAYPRYRRTISPRELTAHYTLHADEQQWVRTVARGPSGILTCAWLLKVVQHLGYFPVPSDPVPPAIAAHLRAVLELPATATLGTVSPRTLYTYQRQIRDLLGLITDERNARYTARRRAAQALLQAAQVQDNPADLINVAVEALIHQVELPAFSTLDRLTRRIRTLVNQRIARQVVSCLSLKDQDRLLALLSATEVRSSFADLKRTPRQASYKHLDELLDHLAWLDSLGSFGAVVAGISPSKLQHFAAEAAALDAGEMQDLNQPKQLLLLVALIHRAQATCRDALVEMFRKRLASFHHKARTLLEQRRKEQQALVEQLLSTFTALLDVLDDAPANPETLQRLLDLAATRGGVAALQTSCETVLATTGGSHLPLVAQFYRSHRSLLFQLVDALTLVSTSQDTSLIAAVDYLKTLRNRQAKLLPATLDLSFMPEAWVRLVTIQQQGQPMLVRRHLEPAIFSCLAAELKSGDVAVLGSDAYTDYRDQLLPWAECQPLLADHCTELGIPATASTFVADLKQRLSEAARLFDERFPENDQLRITDQGEPVLKRTPGREVPPTAPSLEENLLARLPERALLDMLANVVRWTNCTRHFGPLSGSDPKLKRLRPALDADDTDAQGTIPNYIYLLFAYGTNMGPTQAARHLRGAVSAHTLSYLNRRHVTSAKLNAALADIVNRYADLTLPRAWGDGSRVAVDGTARDLVDNNPLAEYHHRYRRRGGVAFRHIADSYIAIFSHFIPCGVWEAIYIIDGLLQNQSQLRPTKVHADTQGQSTTVFALTHLLGIELLPRIRNWKDLIFYKADPATVYQHTETLFGGSIDWGLIERHWTDLLQVVLSIRAGRLSSAMLLRKLGNDSKKNRLYQVFRELGRVIRTLFLLRYLSDQPLRTQITAETNKVESFHQFSNWLTFGRGGTITELDPEDAEKVIKYGDILANAVMLHNVYDMTRALHGMMEERQRVEREDVATLSPYLTSQIKRFGEYALPTDEPPVFDEILGWQWSAGAEQQSQETDVAPAV